MTPESKPIIILRPPRKVTQEKNTKKLEQSIKSVTASARTVTKTYRALAAAVRSVIHGFDELHLTQKASGRGSSVRVNKGDSKEPLDLAAAWKRCKEIILDVFAELKAHFKALCDLFMPGIERWRGALMSLCRTIPRIFSSIGQSAQLLWSRSLSPLLDFLIGEFAPNAANSVAAAAAPILSRLAGLAAQMFSDAFRRVTGLVSDIVNRFLLPTLENVQMIFCGMFDSIAAMWDKHGYEISEKLSSLFSGILELWDSFYSGFIFPALQALGGMLDGLWENHLAPLWNNLTELFAGVTKLILDVWNTRLLPFLQWLTDFFSPIFGSIFSGAAEVVRSASGAIIDIVRYITDALCGLVDFLSGAFSGNWHNAWDGICRTVQGAWNGIISFVKGGANLVIDLVNMLTRAVAAAMNGVIGALNTIHVSIPRWVPVFGGRSFGINLPRVSAPQIPRLATGAVIPPGAEFLAVLGDQKHGRNLEAPESLIRQIVREESGGELTLSAQQPIEVMLDGDVLYRAVANIRANRGAAIGGFFAEAY